MHRPRSSFFLLPLPSLLALGGLWVGFLLPAAEASPLETLVARRLLTETRAGESLLGRLTGPSRLYASREAQYEEMLRRLRQSGLQAERQELEEAVRLAEERLHRFRSAIPDSSPQTGRRLTAQETAFLEHEAARLLRVRAEWRLPSADPLPGEISFTGPSTGTGSGNTSSRARFLAPEPVEAAYRTDVRLRPQTALERARSFVDKIDDCIRSRPPGDARAQDLRFMLQGIGISELFTVTGYIAGSGEKEVDWMNLPTDVFMTALWGVINARTVAGGANLRMRWVRVALMGQARSASDAVYYYFTPLKDTHGRDPLEATTDRWSYNATWNAAMSPVPVALYTLLTGLECLHGEKMAKTAFGIRMATSAATSFAYFRLRNEFVGENSSSR